MNEIIERDKKYVADTYARFPLSIISGKGSIMFDEQGKRYIDMGSGIGVTSFGIADDEWISSVTNQLGQVQHTSNLYYTSPCTRLAEILCNKSNMKKVFFSNSGAEANECAIKVARKYASEKKGSNCYNIITLENSFHGRTLATLSATGQEHFHKLFQPLVAGFVHTPANDIDALNKAVAQNNTAAIMIECVQGEGGVISLNRDFVKQAEMLCKQNDILLIIDEVQTGNGRTGEFYAYMNYGVTPDIVTTAKGLGGGLPIGATLLGDKVETVFKAGDHGSTFGGNPVACAGAFSIVKRIDNELLQSVKEKSKFIFTQLENADGIESVSGMGLMIGFKTVKPASEVISKCMEKGVLCLSAKDKVRLLPALNIPMPVLEEAIDIIKNACAN